MKTLTLLGLIACSLLAPACAPYSIVTPDGMIALNEDRWSPYDYRATTPDGIVVGARQIRMRDGSDVPPADMQFWVDATKLRLRTSAGYALLNEEAIRSSDGTEGVRLEFGRDQEGRTFRYDIALFVTEKFVHVIEAGGDEELYAAAATAVDEAVASYRVRR
ncbi:MAG: hypothetical protein ACJAYU_000924 [Bradymonadia bacterium]|jgi:hypothetical protein